MANRQVRQLRDAITALEAAGGGLEALDAARRLRARAEALESDQVAAARRAGFSWSQIGALYGMTKQGAQQRFRPRPEDALVAAKPKPRRKARREKNPEAPPKAFPIPPEEGSRGS